jgi:hypothetical protein
MLYLVIDRQTGALVSFNGSATKLPTLFQTNSVELQLQFVDVDPSSGTNSITVADVHAQAPAVTIASQLTGVEANEATYTLAQAVEGDFTWDAENLWFTGTLELNTTAMAAWIGANSSATGTLEIDLMTGGSDPVTLFQGAVTVNANAFFAGTQLNVLGTGGTLPLVNGAGVAIAGNTVTVTGLNWATAPSQVIVLVNVPAGAGLIQGNYVIGSATAAGFQFALSGLPDNAGYTFTYIPIL